MRKQFSHSVLGVIIICCFFLMISCGGGGGGSATPPSPPRINVSSTQVAFGDVVLDNFSEQVITVKNIGSSILNIGQIGQIAQLAAPFSILNNDCSGKGLTANQICTFKVQFFPTSQTIQGVVLNDSFDIPSNDSNQNPVTVSVSGKAEGLRLSINQDNTTSCPNIELLISVSDKDGSPISGLQPVNFELFENGVSKPIVDLSTVLSPIPVSVALVLDVSDTMTPELPNVIAASKQFVDLLNPDDEAAIIKFAKTIELKQPFTNDNNALISAIDNAYTGSIFATVMYDALWSAIDNTANQPNHRSVVVISDGKDEDPANPNRKGSVKTLTEVINHAKETEVNIFTIGIGDPVSTDVMLQLANETGGQYFAAPNSNQLVSIYQAIRDILDGQYIIKYSSSSTAFGSITLDVVVNTNGIQGDISRQFQGCP